MRESGYYWVKWYDYTEWIICKYNSVWKGWSCVGADDSFIDSDMFEIDEKQVIRDK